MLIILVLVLRRIGLSCITKAKDALQGTEDMCTPHGSRHQPCHLLKVDPPFISEWFGLFMHLEEVLPRQLHVGCDRGASTVIPGPTGLRLDVLDDMKDSSQLEVEISTGKSERSHNHTAEYLF
jgi:hypothetical protein